MNKSRVLQLVCAGLFVLALTGCHPDMWIQPKYKAQEKTEFFSDHMSSRLPVEGTVPFGERKDDEAFYRGYVNGSLVTEFPVTVDRKMVERGQERFDIFCRHCHGAVGDGTGMISERGFNVEQKIASYHTERLREMPVGHFFDVMTNGYGVMFPFADRISVEDRWAIASYIRVLQKSQFATEEEVPDDMVHDLDKSLEEIVEHMEELAKEKERAGEEH